MIEIHIQRHTKSQIFIYVSFLANIRRQQPRQRCAEMTSRSPKPKRLHSQQIPEAHIICTNTYLEPGSNVQNFQTGFHTRIRQFQHAGRRHFHVHAFSRTLNVLLPVLQEPVIKFFSPSFFYSTRAPSSGLSACIIKRLSK